MKRVIVTSAIAVSALAIFAGSASAHPATIECNPVPGGTPILTAPPYNGATVANIVQGTDEFKVTWSDGYTRVVPFPTNCPQPVPVTPTPEVIIPPVDITPTPTTTPTTKPKPHKRVVKRNCAFVIKHYKNPGVFTFRKFGLRLSACVKPAKPTRSTTPPVLAVLG